MSIYPAFNTIIAAFQSNACLAGVLGLSGRREIITAVCGFHLLVIIGLAIVGLVFGCACIERRCRRERALAAERPHMSSEEFLDLVGLGSRYDELCLGVRKGLAEDGKIPVEVVYPDEKMEFFEGLTGLGIDTVGVVMVLEDELGVSISDAVAEKIPFPLGRKLATTSVADTIRGMIECEQFMALLGINEPSEEGD
ncbi:MAG: hypothetical protein ISS69_07025 [Phycisphaerae bacterium]|nr:hypothetical protein [Phycisphaerae bacterium]